VGCVRCVEENLLCPSCGLDSRGHRSHWMRPSSRWCHHCPRTTPGWTISRWHALILYHHIQPNYQTINDPQNCPELIPSSRSASAKPSPCTNRKEEAIRLRHFGETPRTRFSISTYAIEAAISGSTILPGCRTLSRVASPSVIKCAMVKQVYYGQNRPQIRISVRASLKASQEFV
jgi:hypothetical protein